MAAQEQKRSAAARPRRRAAERVCGTGAWRVVSRRAMPAEMPTPTPAATTARAAARSRKPRVVVRAAVVDEADAAPRVEEGVRLTLVRPALWAHVLQRHHVVAGPRAERRENHDPRAFHGEDEDALLVEQSERLELEVDTAPSARGIRIDVNSIGVLLAAPAHAHQVVVCRVGRRIGVRPQKVEQLVLTAGQHPDKLRPH
mmetsp:Transcript_31129/g.109564  ORF Transcript_31129/g.109564 Transcript_31129/m.109564 type:complete len:200 (+) Transcript_31129:63-662(+)